MRELREEAVYKGPIGKVESMRCDVDRTVENCLTYVQRDKQMEKASGGKLA